MSNKRVIAEHGTICALPDDFLGYFGWPSVAITANGTLAAVASGYRNGHLCPFGRTVFATSRDMGKSWTMPRVINDTPLDDRDAGITVMSDGGLLVTWFTTNRGRDYKTIMQKTIANMDPAQSNRWLTTVEPITAEIEEAFTGSWGLISHDGGATWERTGRLPVTTPHGCILLKNGDLLYLGKQFECFKPRDEFRGTPIVAARSHDNGRSWQMLGTVPLAPSLHNNNCHEPHVVELASGRLLGVIRVQNSSECNVDQAGYINFSMFSSTSDDGGCTWTPMRFMGFYGSPPHLLRHSSGVLLLTYGYRKAPFGQKFALSKDDGLTWDYDWVIRDDGVDTDLGYPCTVELPDGSLFTVYYQKPATTKDRCALLWSRWHLPE